MREKAKQEGASFIAAIEEMRAGIENHLLPSVIYERLLSRLRLIEYYEASKQIEDLARIENLRELASAIKVYESEAGSEATVSSFMEKLTLDGKQAEVGEEEEEGEFLSLMTIHAAKGLEFPVVFLVGVEEGVFPSAMSLNERAHSALEEERRLFYVAMTRAMKRLFISSSQRRMLFGEIKNQRKSRFLGEIPRVFYEKISKGATLQQKTTKQKQNGPMVGDRMFHKLLGEAVVRAVEKRDNSDFVQLDFLHLNTKKVFKFPSSFLEILS